MYYNRAQCRAARSLAEQLLSLAHTIGEPAYLPGVHALLGQVLFIMGEFRLAWKHATQGLAVYETQNHGPFAAHAAQDPGVTCLAAQARALWYLGYPDQALQSGRAALARARDLAHPISLASALNSLIALHHWRGEWHIAQKLGAQLATLARKQAFPHWAGWGLLLRGEILARQGRVEEGIVQMRQGFAALQSTGAQMPLTGLACELAWAYQKAARPEEGLPLLAEALAVIPNTGERFAEAELYRLKGELLLRKGERENGGMGEQISHSSTSPFTHSSPEACFQQALGIARQQQAKSLELRTVICLSRLWQSQGKTRQAHQHLARIYHWFTEGLDTADLQEAKALLKELA
jgi:predicted ATPase